MLTGAPVAEKPKHTETEQRREAIAFLLGWNSKVILLQKTPKDREGLLLSIRRQLRDLGVVLHHPLTYYFADPMVDQGDGAQAFTDETFAQLKEANAEVANHFGAASNLLLTLADVEKPESSRKRELRELMLFLDIPDDLKQVPDTDQLIWAAAIKDYFQSVLNRQSHPRSRAVGR